MITELIGGAFVMSPSPTFAHQEAVLSLAIKLRSNCPPELRVLIGPFAVRLRGDCEVSPDLVVARYVDLTREALIEPPLLTVEVLGSATAHADRSIKKAIYATHGVHSYWLVDPEEPALLPYRLDSEGRYELVAKASGREAWTAIEPFAVTIRPIDLVTGLHP